MKKLITLFTLVASVALGGNEGPGGGAGFKIENEYLTFGSAKVKIGEELPLKKIKGIDLLLDTVDQMALPKKTKYLLREAIFPSETRQYFPLEALSPKDQMELKKKFIDAIGKDQIKGEIVIYAITLGIKTFLLPAFDKIKTESGKAAILFHEAEWVLDPSLKYQFVIDSEIKMQSFIEKLDKQKKGTLVYDAELYQNLEILFLDTHLSLFAAAEQDRLNGHEDLSLLDIIGQEAFDIYQTQKIRYYREMLKARRNGVRGYLYNFSYDQDETEEMKKSLKYHLYEKEMANPSREILKVLNKKSKGLDFMICPADQINWEMGYEYGTTPYASILIPPQTLEETLKKMRYAKIGFKTVDISPKIVSGETSEYFHPDLITHYKERKSISGEMKITVPRIATSPLTQSLAPDMESTCSVTLMFDKVNGTQYRAQRASSIEYIY